MNDKKWSLIFLAWLMALISSAGSLFFSEIMNYPPCSLCWYQRICMFPLVLIILRGLFPLDLSVIRYSLPLSFTGTLIAVYHNLLYYKIIPESLAPCRQGVSCLTTYFEFLGFITIPFLSLCSFMTISILLIFAKRNA